MDILVVDDERIERRFVEAILTDLCPEARVYADLADPYAALELARKQKFDLAFLDIKMPGMDGLELAAELRRLQKDCYIVIHTAHADFDFAQRAIEAGVDSYTLKPTQKEDFSRVLEKYYQRQDKARQGTPVQLPRPKAGVWDDDKQGPPDLISEIEDYLWEHYKYNFTLEEMGRDLHYNAEYLSREYRKQRGITINQRQQQLRIKEACYQLINTNRSIEQIADSLGFLSLSNFYKQFKIFTGSTPRQYALLHRPWNQTEDL
jgi:two-component system response regulator YesN